MRSGVKVLDQSDGCTLFLDARATSAVHNGLDSWNHVVHTLYMILLNSGGSNSPWSEFWSEFPHFTGMGVVPAPSSDAKGCFPKGCFPKGWFWL